MLSVKVKLYLTEKQKQAVDINISAVRWVYNHCLNEKQRVYNKDKSNLSKFDLINYITRLKKEKEFLKVPVAQSLQATIANLDRAYKSFFKKGGFPKYKSRFDSRQSMQFPSGVKIVNNKVQLPKIGKVNCKGLRGDLEGKIKLSTLVRDGENYYLSMNIEIDKQGSNNGKSIGIDVGVKVFAYTSEEKAYKPLDLFKALNELKSAQKSLSNKKKGSKNRAKAKRMLQKKHKRVSDKRKDFIHKLTHKLAKNKIVVVEDLKIKNMTKRANPYKGVKAKSGLNRAIIQQSWGMFFDILEYKLINNGGELIRVNPKFTSQICSKCGYKDSKNRESQSIFKCKSCGNSLNADYNASINILNRGLHGDCLSSNHYLSGGVERKPF